MTEIHAYNLYNVQVPKTTDWQPEAIVQMFNAWFAINIPFNVYTAAYNNRITTYLHIPNNAHAAFTNSLHTVYPQANISKGITFTPLVNYFLYQFESATPFIGSLGYAKDHKEDPLRHVTGAMTHLVNNECIVYELVFCPPRKNYEELSRPLLESSMSHWTQYLTIGGAKQAVIQKVAGADKRDTYTQEITRMARTKLLSPLAETTLNVKINAASRERADEIVTSFRPALQVFERSGISGLVPAS